MATIHTRIEHERGCGYRKAGGMYFVCDGPGKACGRLPIPLTVCPCCGEGIKQSRGFTWVTSQLFIQHPCTNDFAQHCFTECPLGVDTGDTRFGLMWVGEKFYSTSHDFIREGIVQGISKRIAQIPRDFKVGDTWILLAHPKTIPTVGMDIPVHELKDAQVTWTPGIFQAFKPSRIEYVVGGWETDEQLDRLEDRGVTLVKVIRDVDAQTTIFDNEKTDSNDKGS